MKAILSVWLVVLCWELGTRLTVRARLRRRARQIEREIARLTRGLS